MKSSTKTREIIAKILRTTPNLLSDEDAMGGIEHWDSLAQLAILSTIEQEYGLSIEPDLAVELNTVGKICAYVNEHGAA